MCLKGNRWLAWQGCVAFREFPLSPGARHLRRTGGPAADRNNQPIGGSKCRGDFAFQLCLIQNTDVRKNSLESESNRYSVRAGWWRQFIAPSNVKMMKQILFIEDDAILSKVYCKVLQSAGFEIKHCPNGEAGLAALQILRPDLILLDLMLPLVSGQDLLRIIRGSESTRTTPVVVFTSSYRKEIGEELEGLGANRILSKAEFVPRQVLNVIHELLPGSGGGASGAQVTAGASGSMPKILDRVASCAKLVQEINREVAFEKRKNALRTLRGLVAEIADKSMAAGLGPQAYFCEALDTLLMEMLDRTQSGDQALLRTVTQAVDFMAESYRSGHSFDLPGYTTFNILVTDDDSISRCGIQLALGKIKQKGIECSNAREALDLSAQQKFDLIFLDVELPNSSGLEICTELRRSGPNKDTPVIFVTRHTKLQNRAQAALSGGNDVIGKPFHFMELAVKALIHLLRSKLR